MGVTGRFATLDEERVGLLPRDRMTLCPIAASRTSRIWSFALQLTASVRPGLERQAGAGATRLRVKGLPPTRSPSFASILVMLLNESKPTLRSLPSVDVGQRGEWIRQQSLSIQSQIILLPTMTIGVSSRVVTHIDRGLHDGQVMLPFAHTMARVNPCFITYESFTEDLLVAGATTYRRRKGSSIAGVCSHAFCLHGRETTLPFCS